jgi:hypothetical protein
VLQDVSAAHAGEGFGGGGRTDGICFIAHVVVLLLKGTRFGSTRNCGLVGRRETRTGSPNRPIKTSRPAARDSVHTRESRGEIRNIPRC